MFLQRTLLAALLILSGCGKKEAQQKVCMPVSVVKVTRETIPAIFEYVGVVESSHIVELRARVEGYLQQIAYTEGTLVKKGDLMFVLDQRPFQAAVDSAEGTLAREKAVLWNATQQKNRMVPLYEKNAVSQKDLDDAIASELAAQASVITAEADLYKAQINLGFASIESPVTGMAGKAEFREGALISPGPNSLLTNIYVVDPIWVNFSVSQGDILLARQEEAKGRLKLPADKNFKIEVVMPDNSVLPARGFVNFTAPALQQSTGTMLVRSTVANPKGALQPGAFVRVRLKGAIYPNAIIVPQTSIMQGQKGQFVFVVNSKNEVEIRQVQLGNWYNQDWIVNSGLEDGDIVVAQGVNRLQNGSCVEITQWIDK